MLITVAGLQCHQEMTVADSSLKHFAFVAAICRAF